MGSLSLTADVESYITGAAVASELQNIIDGAEQNFMVRRSDTGYETIEIFGDLVVEFDLDSPPN